MDGKDILFFLVGIIGIPMFAILTVAGLIEDAAVGFDYGRGDRARVIMYRAWAIVVFGGINCLLIYAIVNHFL